MSERSGRYLFIHVMKTGGTSLVRPLRRNFEPAAFYPDEDLDVRADEPFHHVDLEYVLALPRARREAIRCYAGHFLFVTKELLGEPFVTMTVLRDPDER